MWSTAEGTAAYLRRKFPAVQEANRSFVSKTYLRRKEVGTRREENGENSALEASFGEKRKFRGCEGEKEKRALPSIRSEPKSGVAPELTGEEGEKPVAPFLNEKKKKSRIRFRGTQMKGSCPYNVK